MGVRIPAPRGHKNWTWDGWTDKGARKAVHTITDDHGNTVTVRRCGVCRRWLPEDYDHFSTNGTAGPVVLKWRRTCRECSRVSHNAWYSSLPAEKASDMHQRRWARILADPERRERQRHYNAVSFRRNKAKARARARRRLDALKADPERYAEYLARRREWARARRERKRLEIKADRELMRTPVPSAPMCAAIARYAMRRQITVGEAARDAMPNVGKHPDSAERLLNGWKTGERPTLMLSRADSVLVNLELNWWDVWHEGSVRLPVLTARSYQIVRKKRSNGAYGRYRVFVRLHSYGDVGPDVEGLERLRVLFEGETGMEMAA